MTQDKADSNYSSRFSLASNQSSYYTAEESPHFPGYLHEEPVNNIHYQYSQRNKEPTPVMLAPIEELPMEPPPNLSGVARFSDGIRSIDFILVYKVAHDVNEVKRSLKRHVFESNLIDEGLQLERSYDEETDLGFIKIHASWEVLSRYADIMKLKMPMKEIRLGFANADNLQHRKNSQSAKELTRFLRQGFGQLAQKASEIVNVQGTLWDEKKRFHTVFSRDKEYLFDIPEPKEDFLFPAQRSQIVDFILKRKRFSNNKTDIYAFGMKNLLNNEVYVAAYPLHEGHYKTVSEMNERKWLMENWANLRCMFKLQPLDKIRRYFGVKIGLYYAWLGFYTYMLIPASVVGICCFLYGIFTMYTDETGRLICKQGKAITMCPKCTTTCSYWKLSDACFSARVSAIFDNGATVFFSIFMSLWGATFLELWKRYSAKITYHWDICGLDTVEEHPRPEFLARLANTQKRKINIITQLYEPYVNFWKRKFPFAVLSVSVVLLMVTIAVLAVIGVIVYRAAVGAALLIKGEGEVSIIRTTVVSVTAATINLACILIFNMLSEKIAMYITELEMPRTQTEFDNSLTLKMFMLHFVNYYSSIFYIAFFKGRFIGHPGQYRKFLGFRQEECNASGCLFELTVQLAIIMVGKQAFSAFMEMILPWIYWFYNNYIISTKKRTVRPRDPWEEDYLLVSWGPIALFMEYLEMIMQFGFVTIFVAAFPLAPLFALLNNTLEIRLDARKFITSFRRPVAQRVRNIGIWYRILDSIGKLSTVTNALIIAFTSNFIPHLYYKFKISADGSMHGYLNHSLSYFNTSDFSPAVRPPPLFDAATNQQYHPEICRYRDYRHHPLDPNKYSFTEDYWHVLTIKLAFVLIFENVVILATSLIRWLIPDIPSSIKDKVRQKEYLINEIIIEQELKRAKECSPPRSSCAPRRGSSKNPEPIIVNEDTKL